MWINGGRLFRSFRPFIRVPYPRQVAKNSLNLATSPYSYSYLHLTRSSHSTVVGTTYASTGIQSGIQSGIKSGVRHTDGAIGPKLSLSQHNHAVRTCSGSASQNGTGKNHNGGDSDDGTSDDSRSTSYVPLFFGVILVLQAMHLYEDEYGVDIGLLALLEGRWGQPKPWFQEQQNDENEEGSSTFSYFNKNDDSQPNVTQSDK